MKYSEYGKFTVGGELGARCALLCGRLQAPIYRPDAVLTMDVNGWPGDWEGRTILALVCQAQATGMRMAYLDEIVDTVTGAFNERGYLGRALTGYADEQQLSGHSWLLRGLCEYYLHKKKPETLRHIDSIVRGLFLPLRGLYDEYPIRPEQRVYRGAEAGEGAGLVGRWYISTDTGCAYIPLDGLTQAYEVLREYAPENGRDGELSALLEEMTGNFMRIPFLGICVQTHATLTGLRGIIRRYEQTGRAEYLDFAKQTFELYKAHGMTPNYANFNWFGRPEWTEPCAIIDSFMVASQLYALTSDAVYAQDAQLILCNGIFRAQRPNGGFGCDSCGLDGVLRVHCYEAYWCCTMRGGEGLAKAGAYAVCGDTLLYPAAGEYEVNGKPLSVRSQWPHDGVIRLKYDGSLKLFIPGWVSCVKCSAPMKAEPGFVTLVLSGDEYTELELTYSDYTDTYNGKTRRYHGALLNGLYKGEECFLDGAYLYPPQQFGECEIQILY